ncbi:MAG TPA: cyclic pyranopterin monophosphate synthase MoaC [bacterium]|nr:cyclic pyranopterin monophosphate synthase MoaC [bacterium]
MAKQGLTHFDPAGRGRMVDVTAKRNTTRVAIARGVVRVSPETFRRIQDRRIEKGDVLGVAQVAGILAAKKTADLIPMCHPLSLTGVEMGFTLHEEGCRIEIEARVKTVGPTGVEMEALCAVMGAGLTIYDMCKAIDRGITLSEVRLVYKHGGKSGEFRAPEFRDSVDF